MDKGEIREELIRIIQELELLKSKIDNPEYKDIIDAKNQELKDIRIKYKRVLAEEKENYLHKL